MNRLVSGGLVASFVAVVLAACGGDDMSFPTSGAGASPTCSQYASCEACTPVLGCGWCYEAGGAGTCAAGPSGCESLGGTWTWNPDGCRVSAVPAVSSEDAGGRDASLGADSGSGSGDAGDNAADAPSSDANPFDTSPLDANPLDTSPLDTNPLDTSPLDANAFDVSVSDDP